MNGREVERSGAKEGNGRFIGNGAKVGEREGLDGIGRFLASKLAAWTSLGISSGGS
jgi:hypothetical protein